MGWRDEERAHNAALREAVHGVAEGVRALRPVEVPRGRVVHPRVPFAGVPGLGVAMRFCRDTSGGEVRGLAQVTRRVPDEYVQGPVCMLADRSQRVAMRCVCGEPAFAGELAEHGCGRWLFFDGRAVYAIRLPEQEPEVVAA